MPEHWTQYKNMTSPVLWHCWLDDGKGIAKNICFSKPQSFFPETGLSHINYGKVKEKLRWWLLLLLGHIAVHTDAAYCYRWSCVVCRSVSRSVCQSLCLNHEPCKNGWTNQDVVWDVHLGRTNEPCISRRSRSPGKAAILRGRVVAHCKTNRCKKKTQLTVDVTRPTWSIMSCSVAEASQRLLRMKMFGFDSRSLTRWKKFFSCAKRRARHRLSTYACKQSTIIMVIITHCSIQLGGCTRLLHTCTVVCSQQLD